MNIYTTNGVTLYYLLNQKERFVLRSHRIIKDQSHAKFFEFLAIDKSKQHEDHRKTKRSLDI